MLLDAASAVLIRRGYGGLRYRDVADAAGVPIASLQHYFPNLADLRREALLHTANAEIRLLAEEIAEIPDPWIRLSYLIETSMDGEACESKRQWMLWLEFWRAAAHDPAIAEENIKTEQAMYELIESAVAVGVCSGAFRPIAPVPEIARTIQAMIDGLGVHLAIKDESVWDASSSVQLIMSYARAMLRIGIPEEQPFAAELAYSQRA
ncbi:MAG: TetR/AcrR family transcriptional regulator [Nocardioides sp.]